jgi:antitoxin component YwqK of YwqJK toxin-antitoxin module
MFARAISAVFLAGFLAAAGVTDAQPPAPTPDAVRVTVSMNADGSRTVYEFDSLRHKMKATTTDKNGKPLGTIRYVLDDASRFIRGEVYGPDDQLRFKTLYKYDDAGRLNQETQLSKDDALQHKLIYAYDKNGRQTGYAVYDAAGKLVSQKGPSPTATPKKR